MTKRDTFLEVTRKRKEKVNEALLEIAMNNSTAVCHRGDLEKRNNDNEDVIEVSVLGLKKMLKEAYELGQQN